MARKLNHASQVRGTTIIDAVTEPRLISAYVRLTAITVQDRQVEIMVFFDDTPAHVPAHLTRPKKLISRDPEVVAFMQRVHTVIERRTEAIDAALEGEVAA